MKISKLLSLATVFLLLSFTIVQKKSSTKASGYSVGDVAVDFKLKNVDDKMVSMADYDEAKGFILIFTCNHCPFSIANEDRILALDAKYKKLGYPVIAINPNDSKDYPSDNFENMKIRAKEKGFTFPYLFDKGGKVYPKYGATKTPHVYVVQKKNKELVVAYIGAIDNNARNASKVTKKYVEDAVNALLKGEKPAVSETKAIGCSIKK